MAHFGQKVRRKEKKGIEKRHSLLFPLVLVFYMWLSIDSLLMIHDVFYQQASFFFPSICLPSVSGIHWNVRKEKRKKGSLKSPFRCHCPLPDGWIAKKNMRKKAIRRLGPWKKSIIVNSRDKVCV